MSFYGNLIQYRDLDYADYLNSVTDARFYGILEKSCLSDMDFLALLSPLAGFHLEEMAQKAHDITVRQFGRTIMLYTPMYLSNFCINQCVYCGFNQKNKIDRHQLSLEEVEREAKAISKTGLKHILILTGDAPKIATMDYLENCCKILSRYFTSISIEIYALTREEYARLIKAGVDGLTLYQETYNEELYRRLHLKGPKTDYRFRLDAPERGCEAAMRSVNVAALFGLDDWRKEVFLTGMHADYLKKKYPDTEIAVSLPRMRPHAGEFQPSVIVEDRDVVQMMTALRIFMPRTGITISTRESAEFRNHILPLGVTKMSAGSCTAVGGRTSENKRTGQFEIADERGVPEMAAMLEASGWQAVYKDWQPIL
jgi:2-iminoacetate synthase